MSSYKKTVAISNIKMKRINMLEAAKRLVDILQNVNFETIAVDLDHVHTQLCDENVKFMPEYIKWVLEVIESLTCRRDAAIQAFKTVDDYVSLSPDVAAAIQNQYLTQVKECITNAIITPSDIIRFCSAETNTCESFPDAYTSAIDLVVQHEADLIGLCEMWAIDVHFNVETLMKMQLVQEFITNQEQAVQDVIAFLKARNLPHSNFIEKFVPKTEELNKKREQQKLLAAEIDRVTGEALNVTSEKKQFEYAMKLSALNQEYYQLYY